MVAFPILETLELGNLHCKRIWADQLPEASFNDFQSLTSLSVSGCHRVENLLSLAVARCLVQLQKLRVSDCVEMKEIVAATRDQALPLEEKVFLKLEQIELADLPSLRRFCSSTEVLTSSLNLKKVSTSHCPKLLWTVDVDQKEEDHDEEDINEFERSLRP